MSSSGQSCMTRFQPELTSFSRDMSQTILYNHKHSVPHIKGGEVMVGASRRIHLCVQNEEMAGCAPSCAPSSAITLYLDLAGACVRDARCRLHDSCSRAGGLFGKRGPSFCCRSL